MEKKIIFIFIIIIIILFVVKIKENSSGWIEKNKLNPTWNKILADNVNEIIFCETDVENIEDWFIRFQVPKEAIKESLLLIDQALKENKIERNVWDIKRMKIITDHRKYVFPVNWTSNRIYGNDWISHDLREYLREHGFEDIK